MMKNSSLLAVRFRYDEDILFALKPKKEMTQCKFKININLAITMQKFEHFDRSHTSIYF